MMGERWIFHLDLDAFFASVEEVLNPELKGKAIIVGGRPDARGVVSSASYPARRYGVRSAMPTAQALRLCPHAILIPGRHGEYGRYSRMVMEILYEYTPLIAQISIDEAFMDVTGCQLRWGPPLEMAEHVQKRILDETQLSASIGIAGNMLVAKVASDYRKPFGLTLVPHGTEADFLAPLAVERLWGVGKVAAKKLHSMGIWTIGDLTARSSEDLEACFGRHGESLWRRARGIDDRVLSYEREEAKSVSHEVTFATDVSDPAILRNELLRLSEKVGSRLRRYGFLARTVAIKLRYGDFSTITRQATLEHATDIDAEIIDAAVALWSACWQPGRPVRLIGVGVHNLRHADRQLSLFEHDAGEARREKLRKLHNAVDTVRKRWGSTALTRAALLGEGPDSTGTFSRRLEHHAEEENGSATPAAPGGRTKTE